MPKKNGGGDLVAQRAWNILRLALLWARKGGVFKRRLMIVPKFLKNLGGHNNNTPRDQLRYGERELSFDKTPIFHVKMHRPASMRFFIPCITPQVDFDYDFDDHEDVVVVMRSTSEDDGGFHNKDGSSVYEHHHHHHHYYNYDGMRRRSFLLKHGDDQEEEEEEEECEYVETCDEEKIIPADQEVEEIDMRAEEFITKFRQQMRLQRQISYLQYHETPKN